MLFCIEQLDMYTSVHLYSCSTHHTLFITKITPTCKVYEINCFNVETTPSLTSALVLSLPLLGSKLKSCLFCCRDNFDLPDVRTHLVLVLFLSFSFHRHGTSEIIFLLSSLC